jgi:hypothetical protein
MLLIVSSYGHFVTVQTIVSSLNSVRTNYTMTGKSILLFDEWWKQALWGIGAALAGIILFAMCVLITHFCNDCCCKCKRRVYSPVTQPIILHT